MDEKKVVAAAVRFIQAAKHTRWAELRRAQQERTAAPVESLGLMDDYYRALADLAVAERDLMLAVDGE